MVNLLNEILRMNVIFAVCYRMFCMPTIFDMVSLKMKVENCYRSRGSLISFMTIS